MSVNISEDAGGWRTPADAGAWRRPVQLSATMLRPVITWGVRSSTRKLSRNSGRTGRRAEWNDFGGDVMKTFLQLAVVVCAVSVSQLADAQDSLKPSMDCFALLPSKPALAPLVGKVVLSGNASASLEMQADKSKATLVQRKAISEWAKMREACLALAAKGMEQAPGWVRAAITEANDERDVLTAALYRGELNYGQFNVKSTALSASLRKRFQEGAEEARREEASSRADTARREEVRRREEDIAKASTPLPAPAPKPKTLQEDLYECQQEAARAFPVAMVQMMTSPGVHAPPGPAAIYNTPAQYTNVDANARNRNSSERSCMLARGYTPQ